MLTIVYKKTEINRRPLLRILYAIGFNCTERLSPQNIIKRGQCKSVYEAARWELLLKNRRTLH